MSIVEYIRQSSWWTLSFVLFALYVCVSLDLEKQREEQLQNEQGRNKSSRRFRKSQRRFRPNGPSYKKSRHRASHRDASIPESRPIESKHDSLYFDRNPVLEPSSTDFITSIQKEKLKFFKGPQKLPDLRPSLDYEFHLTQSLNTIKSRPLPTYKPRHLQYIREEIQRLLSLKLIQKSPPTETYAVPRVVPKSNSKELRMVIDYRELNAISEALPTTVAPFRELAAGLVSARVFTTLDLSNGSYNIRLDPATAHLSAFKTPDGCFSFNVLPAGLSNTSEVLHRFVTHIMKPHRAYTRWYFDDILIFSNTYSEHLQHLSLVRKTLTEDRLAINMDKCVFASSHVQWLGHEIEASKSGTLISPKSSIIANINNFDLPQRKQDVQKFLGYVSSISRHINDYANISTPLVLLMGKDLPFDWTDECNMAFKRLKNLDKSQLQLVSFDFSRNLTLVIKISKFAVGAVILQRELNDFPQLLPVEYMSEKLLPHQWNWSTLDKKLYASVLAVREFDRFIRKPGCTIEAENLPFASLFEMNKSMRHKQARWIEEVLSYGIIPTDLNTYIEKRAMLMFYNGGSDLMAVSHVGAVKVGV